MTGDRDPLACTEEGGTERDSQLQAKAEHLIPIAQAAYDLLKNAKAEVYLNEHWIKMGYYTRLKAKTLDTFFKIVLKRISAFPIDLKKEYQEHCLSRVKHFPTVVGEGFQSYEWVAKHSIVQLMREWHVIEEAYIYTIIPYHSPPPHVKKTISTAKRLISRYHPVCDRLIELEPLLLLENIDALVEKVKGFIGVKLGEPIKGKLYEMLDDKGKAAKSNVTQLRTKHPIPTAEELESDPQNADTILAYIKVCEDDENKTKAHARTFLEDLKTVS